ncbi:MAG: ABC transporter permease [Pseudobutyrivibrio sp.]|nr:ABC transporter permease [Pseudobutyrivibrio sp.]
MSKNILKQIGKYSYVIVFLLIFLVYVITSDGLTWAGVMNIFRHSAIVGIIAFGMGLVCLTGEIDLSVGSMLAIDAGFSVVIFNMTGSVVLTLLFALAFGAIGGLINGILVGYVKMPAFIVTLATMLIYRSFSQYFCQRLDKALIGGGSSVYKMSRDIASYQGLYDFGNSKVATIPTVGVVLVLITIVFVYLTLCTKYGKKVYAIGSNENGAKMAGINVNLVKTSVFVITGILVGLAAFLWIAMNGSCDPATTGNSYEMYAIAAVVLGGISMSGGKGRVLGIFFGALSYTAIDKIIVALKMDSLINDAIKGIILIIVIMIQIIGPQLKNKFKH